MVSEQDEENLQEDQNIHRVEMGGIWQEDNSLEERTQGVWSLAWGGEWEMSIKVPHWKFREIISNIRGFLGKSPKVS